MLKEKCKGIIIGVLISVIITATTGFALNTTTLYDVVTSGIKIIIDGKQLNPTDVNGNPVEPMIYNGTTYLPVRAVANAFDKAVYWDGPEYTVYLGDMDGNLEYPTTYLKDMDNIGDGEFRVSRVTKDNYNNDYNEVLEIYANSFYESATAEYLLNMKYSKFKATMFMPSTNDNDERQLKIKADGKIIYTSPKMTKISEPISIDVNVEGYNHIEIIPSSTMSIYNSVVDIYLADAGFYQ